MKRKSDNKGLFGSLTFSSGMILFGLMLAAGAIVGLVVSGKSLKKEQVASTQQPQLRAIHIKPDLTQVKRAQPVSEADKKVLMSPAMLRQMGQLEERLGTLEKQIRSLSKSNLDLAEKMDTSGIDTRIEALEDSLQNFTASIDKRIKVNDMRSRAAAQPLPSMTELTPEERRLLPPPFKTDNPQDVSDAAQKRALEEAERKRQALERARIAREKVEQAQLEKARLEQARMEREKAEKEEAERRAKIKAEQERLAKLKAEQERLAAERLAAKRLAAERLAAEKRAKEEAEKKRLAKLKAEQERLAALQRAKEEAERRRLAAERRAEEKRKKEAEERIAKLKAEQERLLKEKAELERVAKKKAEEERIAREKLEQEKRAEEKRAKERLAAEKLAREKRAREETERARMAQLKAEREQAEREKQARARAAQQAKEKELMAKAEELKNKKKDVAQKKEPSFLEKLKEAVAPETASKTAHPQKSDPQITASVKAPVKPLEKQSGKTGWEPVVTYHNQTPQAKVASRQEKPRFSTQKSSSIITGSVHKSRSKPKPVRKAKQKPIAVHIGSASNIYTIKDSWLTLRRDNGILHALKPYILAADGKDSTQVPFRLLAGPVKTAEEAQRICTRLNAKGSYCRRTQLSGHPLKF